MGLHPVLHAGLAGGKRRVSRALVRVFVPIYRAARPPRRVVYVMMVTSAFGDELLAASHFTGQYEDRFLTFCDPLPTTIELVPHSLILV